MNSLNKIGSLTFALAFSLVSATAVLADEKDNIQAASNALDTIEPILSYDTAYNLQLAIQQYEAIATAGGWEPISRGAHGIKLGAEQGHVRGLRRRLMATKDLDPTLRLSDEFDQKVDAALRLFQARHGLRTTGVVDQETFITLNVPVAEKLKQLRLNQARVQQAVEALDEKYLVVNIPAASIEAVSNGTVERRHTAIVGRIERQTPILQSKVHEINFNPYWHVPKSIIRRDIIKYMNDDPEYLTKFRIKIYGNDGEEIDPSLVDWSTDEAVQYLLRQEPGAENSMGHVKINFHNAHSVYLHDTPQKSLFGQNRRFHSSGCVRVEEVDKLVSWLLDGNGDWDQTGVDATFASGERLDVRLKKPVPIITTYITAWANRQGVVSFREDIYQFDKDGRIAELSN